MNKLKNNCCLNVSLGSLDDRRETILVAFVWAQSEYYRVVEDSILSLVTCFIMFSKVSLLRWPQRRCQVILSVGLFFNGFLEEIGTVADEVVTGVITVGGSVEGPVVVVAVMVVVVVIVLLAIVVMVAVLAVVAGNVAGIAAL